MKPRGFIQIPLLVAFLLGMLVVGTGFVAYEAGKNSQIERSNVETNVATSSVNTQQENVEKTSVVPAPKPITTSPPSEVNAEIKIEKCKITADTSGKIQRTLVNSEKYDNLFNYYTSQCGSAPKQSSSQTFSEGLSNLNSYTSCLASAQSYAKQGAETAAESAYQSAYSSAYMNCLNQ